MFVSSTLIFFFRLVGLRSEDSFVAERFFSPPLFPGYPGAQIVRLLIHNGANPQHTTHNLSTPVHLAAKSGNAEIIGVSCTSASALLSLMLIMM